MARSKALWESTASLGKIHWGVDGHTKEIVAVEITWKHGHYSRTLPPLLKQIHGNVGQVTDDGAYEVLE